MKLLRDTAQLRAIKALSLSRSLSFTLVAGFTLALALYTVPAARAESPADQPSTSKPVDETYQTLHIVYLTERNEANEIVSDLRNMLPMARVYYFPPQHAISIRGTPADVDLAQKILAAIDQPRQAYRLTYTITDNDNGKRTGSQSYSLVVVPGEKSYFVQGSKVPIVTGNSSQESSNVLSQVQYEDVGLHIEATLEGGRLHTKVEQSSLAEEKSGVGTQDPIVRQTVLDGMSTLEKGKPVVLGSLDLPGGGRRQQIEVVAEAIP
ncbi:MAG: secretin N-terminal domain-containing protein [Terracidiphilus sp.]